MKNNKRSRTKYPGLDSTVNLKIRRDLFDQDYIDKLSDKEKQWLSNFMREYVAADFNHPGAKLNKSKKSKKAIYDANNARNRDSYGVTKINGMLKDEKEINNSNNKSTNLGETEDVLIGYIDYKNSKD